MATTPTDLNAHTRANPELAQHVAYAEEPFRVGAQQAVKMGETAAATALTLDQDKAGQQAAADFNLAQEAQGPETITFRIIPPRQDGQDQNSLAAAREAGIEEREIIDRCLKNGLVTFYTWLSDIYKIQAPKDSTGRTGFVTIANKPTGIPDQDKLRKRTPIDGQSFLDQDIPELVTVKTFEGTSFRNIDKQSEKGDEDTVRITYETLTLGHGPSENSLKYRYDGHSGNILRVQLFLPRSEAEEMVQAIKENPEIVRELAKVTMSEEFEAPELWDKHGPPYDSWRELNNGVSRMAICEDVKVARLEDSQIIEF